MEERRNEIYNSYGQGDGSHFQKAVNAAHDWNEEHGPDSGGFWAGVGDFFGNIWNDLTGKNAQSREFAQQEYLQEKQWEYDSPAAQMERMKTAGINPHTAAAGVAGGNVSQSAPQVASPTPLGNPIETVANVGTSAAGAFKNIVDGIAAVQKLPSELKNLDADTGLKGSLTFLNDTQRKGLEIDLKYKDPLNMSELNLRNQQIENMKKQFDLISNQRKYIDKQLEWYDKEIEAEIELSKKRALEADKNSFKLEQEGKIKELEKNFKEEYKFSQFSNADIAAYSIWEKCYQSGDFTEFEEFNNKYYEYLKDREYNIEKGKQEAITEETFNQAWNKALGENKVKAAYEPYYKDLERIKESLVELSKARYDNVGLSQILGRLMSEIFSFSDKILDEGIRTRGREPSGINPITK